VVSGGCTDFGGCLVPNAGDTCADFNDVGEKVQGCAADGKVQGGALGGVLKEEQGVNNEGSSDLSRGNDAISQLFVLDLESMQWLDARTRECGESCVAMKHAFVPVDVHDDQGNDGVVLMVSMYECVCVCVFVCMHVRGGSGLC
jgi:hypothetical protein